MSVDNLPAELPRDATEYFGSKLMPILETFVKEGPEAPVIENATIASHGELQQKHQWLTANISATKRKRVVILGSGFVAGPVVKHLGSRDDIDLVIGTWYANLYISKDQIYHLRQPSSPD
jgi:alpha-aminoadipic semialdehyde synthase